MRARYLLAAVAVALILALAGCGGGGGGGGGAIDAVADVQGQVLGADGNPIDGAEVEADTGNRAIISATTAGGGFYTLHGIPVRTGFTLTVSAQGTTLSYTNVQVDSANAGGSSLMDIVFTTDTPPALPGGATPTISILPADTEIVAGSTPKYRVRLNLLEGMFLDGFRAIWTVSGATGQVSDGGTYFTISPGAVGTTVRVRAMVRLDNGQVLSAERTMTVTNGGGGYEPPPDPPG